MFDEYSSTLDTKSGKNIGVTGTHTELWLFKEDDSKTDMLFAEMSEATSSQIQRERLEFKF